MSYEYRLCELEMDFDSYVAFLLRNAAELNMPYPFAMKLVLTSSPLAFGKAMLVIDEEPCEAAAAAGFVYGTGAGEYEDRHICQMEVAFIRPEYRRKGRLIVHGLKRIVNYIRRDNPEVTQFQFWVPAGGGQYDLERMLEKLLALPGATRSEVNEGTLALYTLPFEELVAYCERFRAAEL